MLSLNSATLIVRVITLIISFTVHEFAHAWSADRFGDRTPRMNGRLTLNPLAHLDPIGSLLLLVAGFGWAKPVPVNPYALQRRSRSALMWVSFAGPGSNLIMATLAAIPFRLGFVSYYDGFISKSQIIPTLPQFLHEFIFINLLLALFNLIPLAPLDGEKILEFFLPPSWAQKFNDIRPYGPMILLLLVMVLPFLGIDLISTILYLPMQGLIKLLIG